MRYFNVEPEVAGGLGSLTVMDRSVHPPNVSRLHYRFDGWLGDVVLEAFPCFIVSEAAKEKLESLGATGALFDTVEITTSEQFQEMYPNRKLPLFAWLRVRGMPGQQDTCACHRDFDAAACGNG